MDAVIEACDGIEGLIDGIIPAPAQPSFEATNLVGKEFTCTADGSKWRNSQETANVVERGHERGHVRRKVKSFRMACRRVPIYPI